MYTVALGAALLLTGTGSEARRKGCSTSERDCATDVVPCARTSDRRGACRAVADTCSVPGGARTTRRSRSAVRQLLRRRGAKGPDRAAMGAPGTFDGNAAPAPRSAVSPTVETAPRRGERDLQGSDGFMASPAADRY